MKYTLLIIVAATLLGSACKKKADKTNCYICTLNAASAASNGDPAYANPHYAVGVDTICNYNDARINMYIKDHTKTDTVNKIGTNYITTRWTTTCIVE